MAQSSRAVSPSALEAAQLNKRRMPDPSDETGRYAKGLLHKEQSAKNPQWGAFQEGRNGPAAHRTQPSSEFTPPSARSSRVEGEGPTLGERYQLVPGRLSFSVHSSVQMSQAEIDANVGKKIFFFSGKHQDSYEPFCADFGPVNLAVVHHFCKFVRKFHTDPRLEGWELVYYCLHGQSRASETNCAFLLAAFMVIDLGYSPDEAWAPFKKIPSEAFVPFRDATFEVSQYDLTILSCLKGLKKAMQVGWFNGQTFNADEYCYLDDPTIADMHVLSSRIIAFKGPYGNLESVMLDNGVQCFCSFHPEHYKEVFRDKGVSAVVRLNRASTYDPRGFTDHGFKHYELYFDDCTAPSERIVRKFFEIMDKEKGRVAIHCDAGLGRTGTLAALHFMRDNGFTATECIGWLRIVRPGSVIGQQQRYLVWAEHNLNDILSSRGNEGESDSHQSFAEASSGAGEQPTLEQTEALGRTVLDAKAQRLLRIAQSSMSGKPAPVQAVTSTIAATSTAAAKPPSRPRASTGGAKSPSGRPKSPARSEKKRVFRSLRSLSEGAETLLSALAIE